MCLRCMNQCFCCITRGQILHQVNQKFSLYIVGSDFAVDSGSTRVIKLLGSIKTYYCIMTFVVLAPIGSDQVSPSQFLDVERRSGVVEGLDGEPHSGFYIVSCLSSQQGQEC